MRKITGLLLLAGLAGPALAETTLGEVSGNWAGTSMQGFNFRAVLSDDQGQAHLRIWQWLGNGEAGDPQLDVVPVTYRDMIIAGGKQTLEVSEGADFATLNIVTEASDEQYDFREVVQVQFIDNQFTVTGYYNRSTDLQDAGQSYECDVDLAMNRRRVNGRDEAIDPRPSEDDNLSAWGPNAAFERGFCPPPG